VQFKTTVDTRHIGYQRAHFCHEYAPPLLFAACVNMASASRLCWSQAWKYYYAATNTAN